ncbi:uncharacterized protein LOC134875817 isoform X2 [Eleginops maclovinus]|uniref:uncharacterized protein LOC134875817 isoform X2 n=1 Tax=Eleginops maclovinus TaxID=56733 RepID=UPI003081056B
MADEASFVEEGVPPSQAPLVSVSFQRSVNRKQKYLEAEPRALGITQIGLSLFQIISSVVFLSNGLNTAQTDLTIIVASVLLRACLGMQIVAVGASVTNMIISLVKMNEIPYFCWHYYYDVNSTTYGDICHNIEGTISHFCSEFVLIHVALVTISITVAAYCCKVVNCCSPAPKMPVITVQAPPTQQ